MYIPPDELQNADNIDWFLDGPVTDEDVANKWAQLKANAIKRKKEFNLSLKKVRQLLMAKRCAFTGVSFTPAKGEATSKSIDRVDNNMGYVDSNVVACSLRINLLKGSATPAEIAALHKAVSKFIAKRDAKGKGKTTKAKVRKLKAVA